MKEFVLGLLIILFVSKKAHSSETHSIGLIGVGNARELGGYSSAEGRTVKHGVILRAAKLSAATRDDIKRLQYVYHQKIVWIPLALAMGRKRAKLLYFFPFVS